MGNPVEFSDPRIMFYASVAGASTYEHSQNQLQVGRALNELTYVFSSGSKNSDQQIINIQFSSVIPCFLCAYAFVSLNPSLGAPSRSAFE